MNPSTPGFLEAVRDNAPFAPLVRALAAAPDRAGGRSVAEGVLAAIRAGAGLSEGAAQVLADHPEDAALVRALAAAPDRPARSVAPAVRAAILSGTSAGAVRALSDNPGAAPLVRALSAAPDAEAESVEPAVRATIRRGRIFRRSAAAAAAIAVLAFGASLFQENPADSAESSTVASVSPADPALAALAASQRADGSWAPEHGDEALAPAATGLAVLRLAGSGDPAYGPALERAAAWLRARQNADGSFGSAAPNVAAHNLGIPALALLRLYETGAYPELFTPIDGAVNAVRASLSRSTSGSVSRGDVWLASALALADSMEWNDALAGDLRRALLRIDGSGDARFAAVAAAPSLAAKRAALLDLCI